MEQTPASRKAPSLWCLGYLAALAKSDAESVLDGGLYDTLSSATENLLDRRNGKKREYFIVHNPLFRKTNFLAESGKKNQKKEKSARTSSCTAGAGIQMTLFRTRFWEAVCRRLEGFEANEKPAVREVSTNIEVSFVLQDVLGHEWIETASFDELFGELLFLFGRRGVVEYLESFPDQGRTHVPDFLGDE